MPFRHHTHHLVHHALYIPFLFCPMLIMFHPHECFVIIIPHVYFAPSLSCYVPIIPRVHYAPCPSCHISIMPHVHYPPCPFYPMLICYARFLLFPIMLYAHYAAVCPHPICPMLILPHDNWVIIISQRPLQRGIWVMTTAPCPKTIDSQALPHDHYPMALAL